MYIELSVWIHIQPSATGDAKETPNDPPREATANDSNQCRVCCVAWNGNGEPPPDATERSAEPGFVFLVVAVGASSGALGRPDPFGGGFFFGRPRLRLNQWSRVPLLLAAAAAQPPPPIGPFLMLNNVLIS